MTFIRNTWYVASWSQTLQPGKPTSVRLLGEPIVLYRTETGRAVALQNRCSHRLAPLSMGRCEGESLRCMYHGLRFEPDGRCSEIPGQEVIPPQSGVRSYPVIERHGWIWVWAGDAALADGSLIPQIIGPEDGDYLLGTGDLDYRAPANLIWDNLLDFSHLAYVHPNTFNATDTWGQTRPTFTKLPRGVRVDRWVLDQPPLFGDQRSDQWFTYDFLVPGILILKTLTFPVGMAASFGMKEPRDDVDWIQNSYSAHAITPLNDDSARYFFTFGPHKRGAAEEARDAFVKVAFAAFAEDQAFIEAQAAVMKERPDVRIMPTSADRGITLFHLLVDKLVKAEQAASAAVTAQTA
jgi:phenylpropionate dioxygenase-like ring-hydroxylating dioxygenase large terminal subunit